MRISSIKMRFFKDELARSSTIMLVASTFAGFLSYLYQVYMGRALGPEEYSVFGSLFAIFYMIGIIAQTLSTSTTNFVSKFTGEGKQIGFFLSGSLKHMALLGLIVSVIFIASSSGLVSFLKLTDLNSVLALVPILFLTWVSPINGGVLRGVKRFKALGLINVSSAFFKLVFGVVLVALGFGVAGALTGVALGMFIALIISFIFIKPYFLSNNIREQDFRFTSFYAYSLPVMLAMLCFSVPANLDVVLAKYFFSAQDAGLYTSASVLGKVIFFFPAGIYAVMFPMIAQKHARGEDTTNILMKSLFFTAALSGSVAVGYLLFPEIAVNVFGSGYEGVLPLVAPYGFAMFFFSLTSILMYYHLALKNISYVTLFAGFTALEVIMVAFFHSSVLEMAVALLAANFILFLSSLFYTWRNHHDINHSANIQ